MNTKWLWRIYWLCFHPRVRIHLVRPRIRGVYINSSIIREVKTQQTIIQHEYVSIKTTRF